MSNSPEQSLLRRYLDDLDSARRALEQFRCNHVVSPNTASVMAARQKLESGIARLEKSSTDHFWELWFEEEFSQLMIDLLAFLKNK
jgi:hypothetical protein